MSYMKHHNLPIGYHNLLQQKHIWFMETTYLRMTDPRRLRADVSELRDAHCIATDGGHRVICGVLSSTASYLATRLGISLTSNATRRLFRLGLFD